MTKEELAAMLDGREMGNEISNEEAALARASGLVVAFGYSDDNVEFRGALHDEIGAGDDTDIDFRKTAKGYAHFQMPENGWELLEGGWTPPATVLRVNAKFCPPEHPSGWLITSDAPFAPFNIMEDGEVFCVGAVIAPVSA
jgi:hypothetical protein